MVVNARSMVKPDASSALQAELFNKQIDICFITETWLHSNVPSHLICPKDYIILRKDRHDERAGGGVAIMCRKDWSIKSLDYQNQNILECLWCQINTCNSKYYAAVVYHPPDPVYSECDLLQHLSDSCETILSSKPDAKVIIAGDINQLNIRDFKNQHNLVQMVKKPTRGQKTLDVFLTNRPHLWKPTCVFKSLIRSDHMAVMVSPQILAKPVRKTVYIRDARDHRKLEMDRKLAECDWANVYNCNNVEDMVVKLNDTLSMFFLECFPKIKVKTSSRDPPFLSPLVKYLCNKRNKSIRKYGYLADTELQERINKLIRENQVNAVKRENRKHRTGSKGWWDTVNKITGRGSNNQYIPTSLDPEVINSFFQEINTDSQYTAPEPLPIPASTRIPTVDVRTVWTFLSLQKRSAAGPDQLPYWIWKTFADHLAPVITTIFNQSIKQQTVPSFWKVANITPIPKETPVNECSQLRPISITNIIIRLFERMIFKFEISKNLKNTIGHDQFAYKKGCNTTVALLKCQDFWLRALDGNADYVRVLSFDFSKAFDTVSLQIVCDKLKTTNLNPYVINWVIDFLANRKQRVVVNGAITSFVNINKGVPQGTVLGPVLFSLMVNDITVADPKSNLMVKYADDITVCAPVNATTDTALVEVNNIKDWADNNRMSLNISKTWEMTIHGKTKKEQPQLLPDIERRNWLKLLGITFQENPCDWDLHIDGLLQKASSRLYIIRVCKAYGYSKEQLDKLFESLIISVFLYGIEVWGAAYQRKHLDRIDTFFKRSFKFGYTSHPRNIADVIKNRDKQLFGKVCEDNHVLHELLPPKRTRLLRKREHNYILPRVNTERYKQAFINRCLFKNEYL